MYFTLEKGLKGLLAYEKCCKPLCKKMKIPQSAFDILMFLADNPKYTTARDIVEIRGIKANLVSVNVEKLVRKGYLERQSIEGDRRKTKLICTPKAQPIIEQGRQVQKKFFDSLFADVDADKLKIFHEVLERVYNNMDAIMKESE